MNGLDIKPHNRTMQKLVAFVLAAAAFYTLLKLQSAASEYLQNENGFYTVYLPAGIAFLAILVGRAYGALGIFFALVPHYISRASDVDAIIIVSMIAFSLTLQLLVVEIFLFALGINKKLENIRFLHITLLALIFSFTHSLCHYLNLLILTKNQIDWFESKMALGTLFGIFAILTLFWILTKLSKYLLENTLFKVSKN